MGREKAHKLDLFHDEPIKGNPVPAVEEDAVLHDLLRAPMGESVRAPQSQAPLPQTGTPIAPESTPAPEERAQVSPRQEWGGVPKAGANQTAAYQQAPHVPPYTREAGYGNPVTEESQERKEIKEAPVLRPPHYGEGVEPQTAQAPNAEPRRELFQDTTEDGKRISQLSGRAAGMPFQEGQPVPQTAAPQMQAQPQGMGVPFPQMGYQAPEAGYQPNGQEMRRAAPYQQVPGQQQGYPQAAPVYQGSFGTAGGAEGNPAAAVNVAAPETAQNMYGQGMPVQGNEYTAPNYQGQVNGYGTQQSPYSQAPQNGYTPYQQAPQGMQNPYMGQQGMPNTYGQQTAPYPQAGTYQPQGGYVPNEQPSYGYQYPRMERPEAHFQKYRQEVITIYSPKGGAGKSSIAKEIAFCLSMKAKDKEHFKVLLVDADWQYGDVSTLFGKPSFPNSGGWVAQMRKDRETQGKIPMYNPQYIKNFVQHINDTLDILCRSDDPMDAQSVDAGIVRAMVVNLKQCDYDYILFDATNSIRDTTSAHLALSNLILYITTLDATTLNETENTYKALRKMQFDMSKLKVILNKMPKDERNMDIYPQEIENWFNTKIVAQIPDISDKLRTANNEGRCYTMDNLKSDFAKELQKVVNLITPTFKEKKSLLGSLFAGKKGR